MASFEKRPSGWSVRFRYIENGTEKYLRLSGFDTKKAAKEASEAYIREHEQLKANTAPMLFSELCAAYLRDSTANIKESSLYEVRNRLNNHILPTFGDKCVKDITALDVLKWQTKLAAEYSQKYVLVLRYAFSAVWTYGMNYHGIESNPLDKVRQPRDNSLPRELSVWTAEEYAAFREAVCEPLWRLFFDTLINTGLRKGEALALAPSDIQGDYISVTKNITRKGAEAWKVTTPKTKESVRKIKIPPELAEELRQQKGPFIFGGAAPFADRTVERRFKEAISLSCIKPIKLHDMRHTHASWLISAGCSIVAVSKRLGHKSVKQTLDTYSHCLPSDDDMIVSCLGSLLGSRK